jgi:hypothetical protein
MVASMADQATSSANPQTPPAGAPLGGDAPATGAEIPTPGAAAATGAETATAGAEASTEPTTPGFGERGRMRRRLRFLRKARELAYRDLGGLVFEMQRLGERHDELVAAKLATLAAIDTEVRALEQALGDRRSVTVLREAGIAACPRCAAIHGSEDHFCPSCGLAMGAHADRPIAVAPAASPVAMGRPAAAGPAGAPPTSAVPSGVPPASPAGRPPTQPPAQPVAARPAAAWPSASPAPASPSPTPSPASPAAPAATRPAPPPRGPAADAPAPRAPTPHASPRPYTTPPPTTPPPATSPPRTPPPAADDRPTEIIRPSDPPPGEGT